MRFLMGHAILISWRSCFFFCACLYSLQPLLSENASGGAEQEELIDTYLRHPSRDVCMARLEDLSRFVAATEFFDFLWTRFHQREDFQTHIQALLKKIRLFVIKPSEAYPNLTNDDRRAIRTLYELLMPKDRARFLELLDKMEISPILATESDLSFRFRLFRASKAVTALKVSMVMMALGAYEWGWPMMKANRLNQEMVQLFYDPQLGGPGFSFSFMQESFRQGPPQEVELVQGRLTAHFMKSSQGNLPHQIVHRYRLQGSSKLQGVVVIVTQQASQEFKVDKIILLPEVDALGGIELAPK